MDFVDSKKSENAEVSKKCAIEAKQIANKVARDIGMTGIGIVPQFQYDYSVKMVARIAADHFQTCVETNQAQLAPKPTPQSATKPAKTR